MDFLIKNLGDFLRYGGMENPCLTFVTPTIIAGDRSLVSVIQHEITHSWTGNLVRTHFCAQLIKLLSFSNYFWA